MHAVAVLSRCSYSVFDPVQVRVVCLRHVVTQNLQAITVRLDVFVEAERVKATPAGGGRNTKMRWTTHEDILDQEAEQKTDANTHSKQQ